MKADKRNVRKAPGSDSRFEPIVEAFAGRPGVSRGGGKGFGSRALRVGGKIFAMVSSKGLSVVKLPRERVRELVANGTGEYFDPGHGRLMKEWLAVRAGTARWRQLAEEACGFVKRG